jgi:tetratricopeptide (TPR) repeat protein
VSRRRAGALAAGLLLVCAGACAPKTPELPTAPLAPKFPDFVYPAVPQGVGTPAAHERHEIGWRWLQTGDARAAERNFTAALRQSPGFYPAEAGLGYAARARKDEKKAVEHFERAIALNARYAPALVGRGEALLALGDRELALQSLEAALAADPELPLKGRVDVLRFQAQQEVVARARTLAEAGKLAESRQAYEAAIAASPNSPFLYRELAVVERQEGGLPAALSHALKAAELDPADARALALAAEIYDMQGNAAKALELYSASAALEPNPALDARIEALRARAAFDAMPEEYRTIESSPTVTRAQLAALIGVRLDALLARTSLRNAVVITDTRGNWAAPWIMAVARAGVMEVYPNHTFQPHNVVRRTDLALAASRTLSLIAAGNPSLAAAWREARYKFPDVPPSHLHHAAASLAVTAGVMQTFDDGSFQLTRPATGKEAVDAVRKLEELASLRQ